MATPSFADFAAQARPLNPDASDADLQAYWTQKYGKAADEPSAFSRGFKQTFEQLPEFAYGLAGITAAAIESAVGEGGLATGAKKWAVEGYKKWQDKIALDSRDTDSINTSWEKAQAGDPGALLSWAGYALGYTVGQGAQLITGAGVGKAVGKAALGGAVEKYMGSWITKEATRLAEEQAAAASLKTGVKVEASDEMIKAMTPSAVKNITGQIGENAAVGGFSFGMEGGEIGGDLAKQSAERGTALTGAELAKGLTATLLAGTMEYGEKMLGLKAMQGKLAPKGGPFSESTGILGRAGRAAVGAPVPAAIEGVTEFGQTLVEEWGKGNDAFSAENIRQAQDAAALGAFGGSVHGIIGGALKGPSIAGPGPEPADIGRAANTTDAAHIAMDSVTAVKLPGQVAEAESATADLDAAIDALGSGTVTASTSQQELTGSTPTAEVSTMAAQRARADSDAALIAQEGQAGTTAEVEQLAAQRQATRPDTVTAAPEQGWLDYRAYRDPTQAKAALAAARAENTDPAVTLTVAPHPVTRGAFAIRTTTAPAPVSSDAPSSTFAPGVKSALDKAGSEGKRATIEADAKKNPMLAEMRATHEQAARAVEERKGTASPDEAALLDAYRPVDEKGQPAKNYDRIDESLTQGYMPAGGDVGVIEKPTSPRSSTSTKSARDMEGEADEAAAVESEGWARASRPTTTSSPGTDFSPARAVEIIKAGPRTDTERAILRGVHEQVGQADYQLLHQYAKGPFALTKEQKTHVEELLKSTARATTPPKTIQGRPVAEYTEEQLTRISTNAALPAQSRHAATAALQARQPKEKAGEQPAATPATKAADGDPDTSTVEESYGVDVQSAATLPSAEDAVPGQISRQAHALIERLAKLFGKRIVLYKTRSGEKTHEGFVVPGDSKTIYLNVEGEINPLALFGHELMHTLKMDMPKVYAAVEKVVTKGMNERDRQKFKDYYAGAEGVDLVEEAVADLLGNRFTEPAFLMEVYNELVNDNPASAKSLFTRLAQAVYRAIDSMLKVLSGQKGFATDQWVNNLGEVRAAMKEAMKELARTQGVIPMRTITQAEQRANQQAEVRGRTNPALASTVRVHGVPAVPLITSKGTAVPVENHPDYEAAKHGDMPAAIRLVREIVRPQDTAKAREKFGTDVTYVWPHALEASGYNQLPQATALYYTQQTGANDDAPIILQTNTVKHTGSSIAARMIARPTFESDGIVAGKKYVLADDVTTTGNTFGEMANHIIERGGKVVGLVLLGYSGRVFEGPKGAREATGIMPPSPELTAALRAKYGNVIEDDLGIRIEALTRIEAAWLDSFNTVERFRARKAEEELARDKRRGTQALGDAAKEVAPAVTGPGPTITAPTQAEIVSVLREHKLIGLKEKVKRAFLIGSQVTGNTRGAGHGKSDVDVLLEIEPRPGLSSDEVEERYRQKLRQHFVRNNIKGVDDSVHPQWQGHRVDLYFTYDADKETRPKRMLKSTTRNGGFATADIREGADKIAAMTADQQDNLEVYDFRPGGGYAYGLWEARKLAPKPVDKLKKVNDRNSFTLWQDHEYIANVDGEHFGVTKQEDPDEPDDEKKFIYNYARLDDPWNNIETYTDDPVELFALMRKSLAAPKASTKRAKIDLVKEVEGTYSARLNGQEVGRANLAENGEYLVTIHVEKPYRRQGIASQMYKLIEKDIGHELRPSPRHLSPEAEAYWKKRNAKESTTRSIDSPEFKRWFGKSKVVDAAGKPLVVYHGTQAGEDFTEFSVDGPLSDDDGFAVDSGSGSDPSARMGAHFAKEARVASGFATQRGADWMRSRYSQEGEAGARVLPVYLKIENPKAFADDHELQSFIYQQNINNPAIEWELEERGDLDELGERYDTDPEYREEVNRAANDAAFKNEEVDSSVADDLASAARDELVKAGHDGIVHKNVVEGGTSYIVFSPTQVKSAIGNSGRYDPGNPSIIESTSRRAPSVGPAAFGDVKLSTQRFVQAEQSPLYKKRSAEDVKLVGDGAVMKALGSDAVAKKMMAKGNKVTAGDFIGVRINLNVLKNTGVPVQTLHKGKQGEGYKNGVGFWRGEVLRYAKAAVLDDAYFNISQHGRELIATKARGRDAMASVDGVFVTDQPTNFDGVEASFNPTRVHLFVDANGYPVRAAERIVIYGHRAYLQGKIEYFGKDTLPEQKGSAPTAVQEPLFSTQRFVEAEQSPLYEERTAEQAGLVDDATFERAIKGDAFLKKIRAKRERPVAGDMVGVRLNIQATAKSGVPVQTVHEGNSSKGYQNNKGFYFGDPAEYVQTATVKRAYFNVGQPVREQIARKERSKYPVASVDGELVTLAATDFNGVEIRFNPVFVHQFVDNNNAPIRSAEEVTVIGHRAYARGKIEYYSRATLPKRAGDAPTMVVDPLFSTARARDESVQEKSEREFSENYDRVVNAPLSEASTKDVYRAGNYASAIISNLNKHAQRGEPYNKDLLRSMQTEREALDAEWKSRPDRFLQSTARNEEPPILWYSTLMKRVEEKGPKTASAGAWKAFLKGLNQQGVKRDEIEWSGVEQWLDTQAERGRTWQHYEFGNSRPVAIGTRADADRWIAEGADPKGVVLSRMDGEKFTKDQVLAYLESNGVQVEDVLKGGAAKIEIEVDQDFTDVEPDKEWIEELAKDHYLDAARTHLARDDDIEEDDVNEDDAMELARKRAWQAETESDDRAATKKATATVGDKVYEFHINLQDREIEIWSNDLVKENSDSSDQIYSGRMLDNPQIETKIREAMAEHLGVDFDQDDSTQFDNWQLKPAGDNYHELLLALPPHNDRVAFTKSHWSEDNVLAHVRFNERTDLDGKRVLFIEEFQSDWAQKGRDEGFSNPTRRKQLNLEIAAARAKMQLVMDRVAEEVPALKEMSYQERASATKMNGWASGVLTPEQFAAMNDEVKEVTRLGEEFDRDSNGHPLAPFVNKTEAWVGLALKRMIRWAAENGFDRVAWTSGAQQADRYNLAKTVERIVWRPEAGGREAKLVILTLVGGRRLDLFVNDAGVVRDSDDLAQAVGKPLSEVIGKTASEKVMASAEDSLEGDGLQIGGEGMHTFYDRIVPNVVNDVLKKLGGGKVITVPMGPKAQIKPRAIGGFMLTRSDAAGAVYATEAAARTHAKTLLGDQMGFEITPELRAVAMAGLPIMSTARSITNTMTPAQQAAYERIHGTPPTTRDQIDTLRANWKAKFVQGMFDQFAPILDYSKKAYIQARQSVAGDSTLEALLLYGTVYVDKDGAYAVDYTKAGGKQGFASVLNKLEGEHDRFLEWVAAQRAEKLRAIGLENLYSDPDIATLKTLNEGFTAKGTARPQLYRAALIELNRFNDSVLKIARDSGLIDDATVQMYKDTPYVPFYRLSEALQPASSSGFSLKPGLVNQQAWKKLKGGTDKLNADLMANLLQNWSHLITASAKNRAAITVLDQASSMMVANTVPNDTPGKGFVTTHRDGIEEKWAVHDPMLLDAISSLHYAGLGPIAKPFMAMKRALSFGVTVSPAYKIRNLMRDTIQVLATSDISYNFAGNLGQGWKATEHDSETRAQMLAAGGMIRFGSMLDGTSADRTRQLVEQGIDPELILDNGNKLERFWRHTMKPAFDAYQEFGDRGEQMNRAALYEQMIAKGMDHAEAAFLARDLMDFSMSGKWGAIRILTQVVPFFNARLQGLYKLGRAGAEDYKRMTAVVGAAALASLGLMFAYADDDDWKKRRDSDRNNYWWFKIGDKAFRIPKPFEIGAVATLAERGAEYFTSKEMTGKRLGNNVRDIVMQQLAMNPVPQLVKPFIDVYANKDAFSGSPIEGMGMQRLRPQDRYDEKSSTIARFLGSLGLPDPSQLAMGRVSPLSPKQIDYLSRAYFGWLGTSTMVAVDFGIRPMLDRGARPTGTLKDIFGSFVEDTKTPGPSRYVDQMYAQAKEIEEAYNSFHHAQKMGDLASARAILKEDGKLIGQYKSVEALKRSVGQHNTQIQRIEASPNISAETKRTMIDRLNNAKNRIAAQLPTP